MKRLGNLNCTLPSSQPDSHSPWKVPHESEYILAFVDYRFLAWYTKQEFRNGQIADLGSIMICCCVASYFSQDGTPATRRKSTGNHRFRSSLITFTVCRAIVHLYLSYRLQSIAHLSVSLSWQAYAKQRPLRRDAIYLMEDRAGNEMSDATKINGPHGERRTAPRYMFIATVDIVELGTNTRMSGRVSEISRFGCYVDILNALPKGTAIRIRIYNDSGSFESAGKIIYVQENMGMGVGFVDPPDDQMQILDRWLAELAGGR